MLKFRTEGYNGYSVKYSPFFDDRMAVATSANFGLVGNGKLFILGLTPQGIREQKTFDTQDGLFDIAWSESHENHILTSSGDGSLKLYDITLSDFPILTFHEHTREVFSTHYNLIEKSTFLSTSWDGTIKVWEPQRTTSLWTGEHGGCVYQAAWSPHHPNILASVSGEGSLKTWDPRTGQQAAMTVPAHQGEILSMDWNKYHHGVVMTASVDKSVKSWDLRNPGRPLQVFLGHKYAVRRVSCCPHDGGMFLTGGYDMSVRLWQADQPGGMQKVGGNEVGKMDAHREFVMGLDWSLWGKGWAASTGWDEHVYVFDVNGPAVQKR